MNLKINFSSTKPFTITYLFDKKQDRILLLKSLPGKQLIESKWLGIGGKIEKGENLTDSAIREFWEETGLKIKDPVLRGTWTWLEEPSFTDVLYIFFATKFSGKLLHESKEGELKWHDLDSLLSLKDFAPHQLQFLPKLLEDDKSFFSGLAVYSNTNKLKLSISN